MTGRLAATGLELVERAFQQLPKGQELPDEAAVLLQQAEKNPALAAGLIEARGQHNNLLSLCYYIHSHKENHRSKRKNEETAKFC
jgi:hypothetical protein